MVWKELYIESAGKLGGLGRWFGAGLAILLAGGSLTMAVVMLWGWWPGHDSGWSTWARSMLSFGVGGSGTVVAWLIEWAIGLRAAVTIASERERGTWDAILTSPLEAREIIRAKLWGSLFALRWLFAAAILAWTITFAVGALSLREYANLIAGTLVSSAFMAAVGLRSSLTCTTATRAMAVTIGIWLGALIAFAILSFVLTGIAWVILFLAVSVMSGSGGLTTTSLRGFGPLMMTITLVLTYAPEVVATLILISLTSLRFDRLAGRSAGGRLAVAADRFLEQPQTAWALTKLKRTPALSPSLGPTQPSAVHSTPLEESMPDGPEVSQRG